MEFNLEFAFPCETGEAISWAGASAVHLGEGTWNVCAPGTAVEPYWLGTIRAAAVVEFVELVRSLWPVREFALRKPFIQGGRRLNDFAGASGKHVGGDDRSVIAPEASASSTREVEA